MVADAVPGIAPLADVTVAVVVEAVVNEISRVDAKARAGDFGGTHIMPGGPDHDRISVLVEEVGEVARELNEHQHGNRKDRVYLYGELIQLAGSATAWAAAIMEDR